MAKMHLKILALLLACCALVACGSDGSSEPHHSPMISNAGELVRELAYVDGTVPVYSYRGVLVYGDMKISDFARAHTFIAGELDATETIVYIYNNEAFPPSMPPARRMDGDLSIWSCTEGGGDSCTGGNAWGVATDGGTWSIVARAIWRS